jgi:predicted RND superfamily exporter protein
MPSKSFERLLSPKPILVFFGLLTGLSIYLATTLYFSYDFEQFFPKGDPDLEFFYEFRDRFEPDDNFLLVSVDAPKAFFDLDFLTRLDSLTRACSKLPHTQMAFSVSNFRYGMKTPFGFVDYAALHVDKPERYQRDSLRLAEDERIMGKLVSPNFRAAVIPIKTQDSLDQQQSEELIDSLNSKLLHFGFEEEQHHIMGRANFQSVLVYQQQREFMFFTVASGILVFIVFLLIFRKLWLVIIGLSAVVLAMVLFLGLLGAVSRPLDYMSTLYPVLLIIVGVSDVVHIVSKYTHELRLGKNRAEAMRITRREIGLATLLTSITTAIGFLTLVTSKVPPVKAFGYFAAAGVLVAYIAVIGAGSSAVLLMPVKQVIRKAGSKGLWENWLMRFYHWGLKRHHRITWGIPVFLLLAGWGISRISTDVHIGKGLPKGYKITEDFFWYEEQLGGFRPFEMAAHAQGEYKILDREVLAQMDSLEQFIRQYDAVRGTESITALYKSVNRAMHRDRASEYRLPQNDRDWREAQMAVDRLPDVASKVLLSKDETWGRISSTIHDIGSDSINLILEEIQHFVDTQTDPEIVRFRSTGTGLIFDKNNEYLRGSLVGGLSFAFVAVSILMALLFRDIRMVLISLVPNIIPLLCGAAAMGILGIELDAQTAIIFAISFGIAVDDTIHFLSKLRLELSRKVPLEQAIQNTFVETGKAIILTSLILFFGFMILLGSATPGTAFVGGLVGLTLGSAVFADLIMIPWLLRNFYPKEVNQEIPEEVTAPSQIASVE